MPKQITIYLGADHRGYAKKEMVKNILLSTGQDYYKIVDKGAKKEDPTDDFNDPAIAVARAIIKNPDARGILLCGSAHGVCMQANRFKGVRAINAANAASARIGRAHDDANVLCLSADRLSKFDIINIIRNFFETKFDGGENHYRRIQRLDEEPKQEEN